LGFLKRNLLRYGAATESFRVLLLDQRGTVGLYKFANPVDPERLKAPGFNP
jgi:hypothetical protein